MRSVTLRVIGWAVLASAMLTAAATSYLWTPTADWSNGISRR